MLMGRRLRHADIIFTPSPAGHIAEIFTTLGARAVLLNSAFAMPLNSRDGALEHAGKYRSMPAIINARLRFRHATSLDDFYYSMPAEARIFLMREDADLNALDSHAGL